jgi:hypothetical protein
MTRTRRNSCSSSDEEVEVSLTISKVKVLTKKSHHCEDGEEKPVGVLVSWDITSTNTDDLYVFKLNGTVIEPTEPSFIHVLSRCATLPAQSCDPCAKNYVPGFGDEDKAITLSVSVCHRGKRVSAMREFYTVPVGELECLDADVLDPVAHHGHCGEQDRRYSVRVSWHGGENTEEFEFFFNCVKKTPQNPATEDIPDIRCAVFDGLPQGSYKIEVVAKNSFGLVQRAHKSLEVPHD